VVLLLVALRRIGDILLTLLPLLIAGVVTLELCVVLDRSLNFANTIALPLLLGVGVAFKICYHHGVEGGKNSAVAIEPHSRCGLQRHDHRNCIWQPVAVRSSRHFEHGKIDGVGTGLHHGGGGVLSARINGAAPETSIESSSWYRRQLSANGDSHGGLHRPKQRQA
jgi:hypothetical protein